MEQRLDLVTLAVADVEASHGFYVDGLGWESSFHREGRMLMLPVGPSLLLSLWSEQGFEAEVGPLRRGAGHAPITLAHNVASAAEVDEVLEDARSVGAAVQAAVQREWGGYSGYFADPDGYRWEVAHAPGVAGTDPEEDPS